MFFKETCNFKNITRTINTVSYKKNLQVTMFGPITTSFLSRARLQNIMINYK